MTFEMFHTILNLGVLVVGLLVTVLAAWFLIAPEHVAARLHCGGRRPEPAPAVYRRMVRFYRMMGTLMIGLLAGAMVLT